MERDNNYRLTITQMLQLGTIGRGGREFASSSRFKQTGLQSASKSYFNIRRAVRTVHSVSARWHCLKTPATSRQHKSSGAVWKWKSRWLSWAPRLMVSVDLKQHLKETSSQSSGAVWKWKSRWLSWAPRLMVSVDLKQHLKKTSSQSSGAVWKWKSRWLSWAPRLMVSVDLKQHLKKTSSQSSGAVWKWKSRWPSWAPRP